VALPPPFNAVTNACSNNNDCANVSVDYNIGKLIRDAAGTDEINLGFTKIDIGDAIIKYDMGECAAIEIIGSLECGLCVPCKADKDCAPIDVLPLVSDIFSNDLLLTIASGLLLDLIWGGEEAKLHFFCQTLVGGYGACIPCGNPTVSCGSGLGGGSGTCDHSAYDPGTPLDSSCGYCEELVCFEDDYCCNVDWDDVCVDQALDYCDPCLDQPVPYPGDTGNACIDSVCDVDPWCCGLDADGEGYWDSYCVDAAYESSACGFCN
jgi:hypothetical protein